MSLICYKKIAKELKQSDRVSQKQINSLKDCLQKKPQDLTEIGRASPVIVWIGITQF